MKYLVDGNVLSEVTRPGPNARVVEWLRAHESEIVLTPIVLGEIEYGILLLAQGRERSRLQGWFRERVRSLAVVDFDAETGSAWAALLAKLKRNGRAMPIKDSLIAASAIRHGLIVCTRNVADFEKAGVGLVNPFG